MHTLGPGICRENRKTWKGRQKQCLPGIWLETLKKKWKMKNAHCRTWSIARKMKIIENEKHTL